MKTNRLIEYCRIFQLSNRCTLVLSAATSLARFSKCREYQPFLKTHFVKLSADETGVVYILTT